MAYEKAVKIDPKFAKAWYNLSTAYHLAKRHEESTKAYQEAVKLDPELQCNAAVPKSKAETPGRRDRVFECSRRDVMTWQTAKEIRKRLAAEQGTIFKDWGGKLPVALIYPNSYHIGMSNLGIQAIYRLINDRTDAVCERVFWEPKDTIEVLPLAMESQRPLTDFAVIAFSLSYELDYFNIVPILKASRHSLICQRPRRNTSFNHCRRARASPPTRCRCHRFSTVCVSAKPKQSCRKCCR